MAAHGVSGLASFREHSSDDNGNRLAKTVGTTTIKTSGYDAAGRTTSVVTSAGTTSLAYDFEGRVTQITYPGSSTNTFTYNGLDTRVGKVDSTGTYTYRRDGDYVMRYHPHRTVATSPVRAA